MTVLDTNAVLRFLLRDDEDKAVRVHDIMEQETCLIPIEVLAEAVYVLAKTYCIERTLIQEKLLGFLWNENVETPCQGAVETALRYFGETKLDFVDCLMIGYAVAEGHRIFTFDKKLNKTLASASV
jgi:predicted nucleic-acid-binding protein